MNSLFSTPPKKCRDVNPQGVGEGVRFRDSPKANRLLKPLWHGPRFVLHLHVLIGAFARPEGFIIHL